MGDNEKPRNKPSERSWDSTDEDKLILHAGDMRNFINTLQTSEGESAIPDEETIEKQAKKLSSKHSVQDLRDIIRNSAEGNWRVDPLYYLAALRALRAKIAKRVHEYYLKEKGPK